MVSISGEESADSNAQVEKIFVSVRLRPLNEKERSKNDVSDWECINDATIIFKNSFQERMMAPTAYTFDRVFGPDCPTRQVYEEAAKKIALSVLSGMNSSIFAYGQTSSGKTYTMSGITEYAVEDIYNYIEKNRERDFVLKFSAIEIYNELVKDLLSSNDTPLRLLDDPERGTVVDKLTEVTLRDLSHLKQLLSVCESQRQIGETTLNEMSSRSHQILRLIVESEARDYFSAGNSSTLTAAVNFVDLAGSERASQTLSAGTRLKEGSHINRSLLTLGTVIRKLSKGRNGHIPYRDSKLTRILQNSLGGNAKTAIICTLSPARGHIEQSKNTLLFASCAKQVSMNAQVNVVMSEKVLVKQLQKKLAKMENELKNLRLLASSCDSTSALKEKELLIEKMDKEITELTNQRDLAQSRVDNTLKTGGEQLLSKSWVDMNSSEKASTAGEYSASYSASEASEIIDPFRSDIASNTSPFSDGHGRINSGRTKDQFLVNSEENEEHFLSDDVSPTLYIDKYFGPDPCKGWEKIGQKTDDKFEDDCKEVQCIEMNSTKGNTVSSMVQCIEMNFTKGNTVSGMVSPQKGNEYSGESPGSSYKDAYDSSTFVSTTISPAETPLTIRGSPSLKVEKENKHASQVESANREKISGLEPTTKNENLNTENSQSFIRPEPVSEKEQNIKILNEDDCITKKQEPELVEVIKPEIVKQIEDDLNHEDSKPSNDTEKLANAKSSEEPEKVVNAKASNNPTKTAEGSFDKSEDIKRPGPEKNSESGLNKAENKKQYNSDWYTEFDRQKREIIGLWDACHIPLVHRTYFFLLFKGDPADAVYMEVELRRLAFLKNTLNGEKVVKDDQFFTHASSAKTLNREREMLSKRMLKKFTGKEREDLYHKWGIDLKSKQRRLQLCRRLWTESTNMEHIKESAAIVAKLVGMKEPGQAAPNELVGLSFVQKSKVDRSFSWRRSLPSMK